MSTTPSDTYASEPECPACGCVQSDASELFDGLDEDDDYETECRRCEAPIRITRSVSVTYVTALRPVSP